MNNLLVAIAVFLIAVLAAAFAVPRVVKWESYRGVIEEEATRILGRDVRVGGAVKIRLLPSPTFSVEKIRIADTEANTGEPFFQAEALKGRLAIAPLLRGVFQASEMVLSKPLLHLVLDGEGGGNWKTFGAASGQLPFQLSDVALDDVKIEGGVLGVFGPDRGERLRLEAIDGVLSAQALDGPFRFRGFFGTEPTRRDLRLSTTKQEADGSIRFKAALRQTETGATFNFDARAVDLTRSPRVEGELTATVPLPQLTGPLQGGAPAQGGKVEIEAPVEVKAALSADLKLVKLANLSLAFERMGRPQILTGEAAIDLARSLTIKTQLSAKWLDLDQVIGSAPLPGQEANFKPQGGPIEGLLTLARRLNGFTPDQGQTALVLDVEQANLGREAVSGLRLSLVGSGAETDIRELRLGLPGGAQADVKGLMTGSGEETSFSGDIVLRGASLSRFLGWSTGGALVLDPARDGPFAMRSRLITAPGSVEAREFTGELAGTIMQGELGYRWSGRPEVSVLIEGPRVDLRAVLGGEAAGAPMASLASYLTAGSRFGAQAGGMDAVLRVRAGELLVPGGTFVDAAADVEMRAGRVRVSQLRLAAEHGVTVDVEGDMPTGTSAQRGTLRGSISAATAPGLKALADMLAVPADLQPDAARLAGLVPLRLAGAVTFSGADAAALDVVADGDVTGTRVTTKARFDKGLADWRAAPLDMALSFQGPRGYELARSLFGIAARPSDAGAKTGASSILVQLAGTPRDGLMTHVALADSKPRLTFTGRTELGDTQGLQASGDLVFDSADVATAMTLLTPTFKPAMPAIGMSGRARLESKAETVRVERIDARVAGVAVSGQLVVDQAQATLKGRLKTDDVPVVALLQPMLGSRTNERGGAVWPIQLFDDKALADFAADIDVSAARVSLPNGIALQGATFKLALAPGRVEVRDLEGRGAGGTWSGALKLDAAKEGAALTSVLRLKDVQMAAMRGGTTGVPPAAGSLSGLVTLNGRGATPHDVMSSMTGRGTLAMSDARLALLSPAALTSILQTTLRAQADAFPAALKQQVGAFNPTAPTVLLPARSIEVEVKNGIAALSPVGVESVEGKAIGSASVDLGVLALTGTWRVEAAGDVLPPPPGWTTTVTTSGAPLPRKALPPLPALVMTMTAPLAGLGQAKIDLSSEALEREVAVRKVERDLEDLERLRKLDDERAKEEAERRKALENGALPPPALGVPGAVPPNAAAVVDPSTEATVVPDTVDPSTRPKPAAPAVGPVPGPAPAPKPAYRPLSQEEQRRIFGGG